MSTKTPAITNQDALSNFKTATKYFQEKDYLKASSYLEKAIEKEPSNPEFYLMKSQCEYNSQNFSQALQDINKGLKFVENEPQDDGPALFLKARLLNIRSQVHKDMQNLENAQIDSSAVKNILQRNSQSGKLSQLLSLDLSKGNDSGINESSEHREYYSARVDLFSSKLIFCLGWPGNN